MDDVNETVKEKVQYRYKVSRLCIVGPSPIKRVLGLKCVSFDYCILLCVSLLSFPWSKRFFAFTMMSMSSEAELVLKCVSLIWYNAALIGLLLW